MNVIKSILKLNSDLIQDYIYILYYLMNIYINIQNLMNKYKYLNLLIDKKN